MARVTLQEITAGFSSVAALNSNFAAIAAALNELLSRSGDVPNQMEADLDLNGHVLLNSGTSDDPNRVVSYQEMVQLIAESSSGIVMQRQELQTATAAQTVFNLTEVSYTPGTYNLAVYVDGVRKFSPADYVETSSTVVTFTSGLSIGQDVQFVTNEYLSTTTLTEHTHPWSQITSVPVYTTRWPSWSEVTDKPTQFTAVPHSHPASEIASGRLADAQRGVWVQASQPSSPTVGDIWAW